MTDDEKATAVVDALRGWRVTSLVCSNLLAYDGPGPGGHHIGCSGRLAGYIGERLVCRKCGQIYDIRVDEGSFLWEDGGDQYSLHQLWHLKK